MASEKIEYPYIPEEREIFYVSMDNSFMAEAKEYSKKHSIDKTMPTGSVVVRGDKIIGIGANGSDYHQKHECERVKRDIPTGEGYELCEGCHPKNHSESRAINDALTKGENVEGLDLYMWGHWWCCKPCWDAIEASGIANLYLLEGSEKLFNKKDPDNIVGRQFKD